MSDKKTEKLFAKALNSVNARNRIFGVSKDPIVIPDIFEEALTVQEKLNAHSLEASRKLQDFPKGPMGITPDAIREKPEYQAAKRESDKAFHQLRAFNTIFVKKFKKEYATHRTHLRNSPNRTLGISRKTLKQPSARTVEKMFGLQKGETYDYEDQVSTDEGSVKLGKHRGEITLSENSGSYTVWVKGIGNVGFGFSKAEAVADARKNISAKASKAGLGIDQSTITDHSTKSSRSKYKGKIKPFDLREMQTRLDKYLERYNTTVKELQAKYLASGFTPMRFRWDLFSAAIAKPYDTGQGKNDLVNRIYSYADDTHIDTALRFIIANTE